MIFSGMTVWSFWQQLIYQNFKIFNMATKEEYEYGQRALINSRFKISSVLKNWDYERNGVPTPIKLSNLIPMGIKTVQKHFKDFKSQINEINKKEQERLDGFQ